MKSCIFVPGLAFSTVSGLDVAMLLSEKLKAKSKLLSPLNQADEMDPIPLSKEGCTLRPG